MTSKSEKKEEIITPKGDKVYVTKEGLKRLEEELEFLRNVKRPQIAEKLENAVQAFGELTENAEYEETKREQALVEGRISELEDLLSKAIIIDTEKISKVAVGIGSKVKILVKNLKDKSEETMEFMLVSSIEGEPDENKISIDSPIGEAILGKRKGDVVKVKIPKGEVIIKIISIEK